MVLHFVGGAPGVGVVSRLGRGVVHPSRNNQQALEVWDVLARRQELTHYGPQQRKLALPS